MHVDTLRPPQECNYNTTRRNPTALNSLSSTHKSLFLFPSKSHQYLSRIRTLSRSRVPKFGLSISISQILFSSAFPSKCCAVSKSILRYSVSLPCFLFSPSSTHSRYVRPGLPFEMAEASGPGSQLLVGLLVVTATIIPQSSNSPRRRT